MRNFYIQMIERGPDSIPGWILYLLLLPFSWIFNAISCLRVAAFRSGVCRSYQASVPVVSVGNLTTGGTGKTPVVDALVKLLLAMDKKVAVISRGYRGTYVGEYGRVTPEGEGEIASAIEAGDEPFLLALRNPEIDVYVARERFRGVAAAEAAGADCIVLDDAFQHLKVSRDLDIVLLDGRAPFGNGSLLPAGNLRETRRALERADLVLVTHAGEESFTMPPVKGATTCRHSLLADPIDRAGKTVPWKSVIDKQCVAFAGIAQPKSFFQSLREKGCSLLRTLPLADHQDYDDQTLNLIANSCRNADYLLTTEKDIVKLQGNQFPVPCLAIPLTLEFDNVGEVEKALGQLFGEENG